jgi:hypothetical protein
MSSVRALLLAPTVLALCLTGAAILQFTTEITPANAARQALRLCIMANAGISIDHMTGLSGLAPRQYECGCAVTLLERTFPGGKAARVADSMRRLLVNRVKAALTGERPPAATGDRAEFLEIARYFKALGTECAT